MDMVIGVGSVESDKRIEYGRSLLYAENDGLYPVAIQLLNLNENKDLQLPHREAFLEIPEVQSRYELYATRAGGLAIKRIVGSTHINIETDALNIPQSGFVSTEHILKRSSSRGRVERLVAPMIVLLGESMVDTRPSGALDYYLKNYIQVAESMRDQLRKIIGE